MPLTNVDKPILMIPDDELPQRRASDPRGSTRGHYPDPPLRPEIRLSSPVTHAWVGLVTPQVRHVLRGDLAPFRIHAGPGRRRR
jgi:hypothetical protein